MFQKFICLRHHFQFLTGLIFSNIRFMPSPVKALHCISSFHHHSTLTLSVYTTLQMRCCCLESHTADWHELDLTWPKTAPNPWATHLFGWLKRPPTIKAFKPFSTSKLAFEVDSLNTVIYVRQSEAWSGQEARLWSQSQASDDISIGIRHRRDAVQRFPPLSVRQMARWQTTNQGPDLSSFF